MSKIFCICKIINEGLLLCCYFFYRHEEVEEARVSLDEIKKMAKTVSKAPDFSRDNLHEWMATKRQQRMEEYKRHLEELREREAQPFKHKPGEIDHVRNHPISKFPD